MMDDRLSWGGDARPSAVDGQRREPAARPVRFGIVLPTRDFIMRENPAGYRRVFEVAERAEALGYDSVWVGDSIVAKPRLDALTALAYLAARTSRVGLGTSVLLPTLREPVQLAYTTACLDLVSGGRLTLGMGMGAADPAGLHEYRTVAVDPDRRVSRLEETLLLLRRLWTEDAVSFQGRHFRLESVAVLPRPAQPRGPRLLLSVGNAGALTPRQARRVVELGDGIMPSRAQPAGYQAAWEAVQAEAVRRGRDPATLEAALYWTVHVDDDAARAAREADDFLVGYYGRRLWSDDWGFWGPASLLRQRLDAFIAAGVQLFVVRFAAWDPLAQLERFTEEVYAHYR
jgi:alkanesulfonate monooxygenase SsuD/methylene tetrahydromethanopterin reductase-like flavin-dependent oxidoreductase (luciferase family)